MNATSSNGFSINAKTCTLKYNSQKGGGVILDGTKKYVIPIYQRPYSWTEEQIRKFISDLFLSYWGNEQNIAKEPVFIGTMQLSEPNGDQQNIIDGQQRLTTFLILLKVLKQKFPDSGSTREILLDWLITRVNNGKQQQYLEEAINADLAFNDETLNPYLRNANLIREIINEELIDDNNNPVGFDIDDFLHHMYSNIYFVAIETRAGLSKTLQIFNAINTTGLDLNGGDVFKLRMFEYLRDKKGRDEAAFNDVSRLYEKIDAYNKEAGYAVTSIIEILGFYQQILIAKNNLPVVLYAYGADRFYEQLFDTIFNNNQWEHFRNNVAGLELSLEEIDRLIEARYEWENNWCLTAEDMCCYKLIAQSRYGRYVDALPVILLYSKIDCDRFDLVKLLARVYFIYSVRFQKSIYEIQNWTYDLIKEMVNGSTGQNLLSRIRDKIGNEAAHNRGYYDLNWFLAENLTENAKRKNLICRLSAMLEEDYKTSFKDKIQHIERTLWETAVDIEHIQSYHDINGEKREDIWDDWGDNINSIGNLVILEQEINRSISNQPYEVKTDATRHLSYKTSKFGIVQKQIRNYPTWTLTQCLNRKETETKKILEYLFEIY